MTTTRSRTNENPTRWPQAIAAGLALAALMVAGVLVLGRLASTDIAAMVMTTVFFLLVAGGTLLVVRRRRSLLLPLVGAYLLVAGTTTVLLGAPLVFDDVVDEEVVTVPTEATQGQSEVAPGAGAAPDDVPGGGDAVTPTQLAAGEFQARSHPGSGTATLIDTGTDQGTVLTFTDFETDNGPDLFVYLVPPDAPEGSVDGGVNLGGLKGNVGNQQYEVGEVDAGDGWRAVVWCRAFAVTFTEAELAA